MMPPTLVADWRRLPLQSWGRTAKERGARDTVDHTRRSGRPAARGGAGIVLYSGDPLTAGWLPALSAPATLNSVAVVSGGHWNLARMTGVGSHKCDAV